MEDINIPFYYIVQDIKFIKQHFSAFQFLHSSIMAENNVNFSQNAYCVFSQPDNCHPVSF